MLRRKIGGDVRKAKYNDRHVDIPQVFACFYCFGYFVWSPMNLIIQSATVTHSEIWSLHLPSFAS